MGRPRKNPDDPKWIEKDKEMHDRKLARMHEERDRQKQLEINPEKVKVTARASRKKKGTILTPMAEYVSSGLEPGDSLTLLRKYQEQCVHTFQPFATSGLHFDNRTTSKQCVKCGMVKSVGA